MSVFFEDISCVLVSRVSRHNRNLNILLKQLFDRYRTDCIENASRRQFHVPQIMEIFSEIIQNIVGIGENAGYQHFLLFQQCFQTTFLSSVIGNGIVC